MGHKRDFRQATIEMMQTELVDNDPEWKLDNITDGIQTIFTLNASLKEDMSNFGKYMGRVLEINDITSKRLEEIIIAVHEVEDYHKYWFELGVQEMQGYSQVLKNMAAELLRSDFATTFDASGMRSQWLDMLAIRTHERLDKKLEEYAVALKTMITKELLAVDVDTLTASERVVYYTELYRRLNAPNLSAAEREAILEKLSQMSDEDARNIVFDVHERIGGNQGVFSYDPETFTYTQLSAADVAFYEKYLMERYGISKEDTEKILQNIAGTGCSMVATVNSIFLEYANKPDEFEQKFGFPYFDANGNPNFELLLVDYCYHIWKNEGAVSGSGTESFKERLETYTDGVTVTQGHTKLTNESLGDMVSAFNEGKTIYISMSPSRSYELDGDNCGIWNTGGAHGVLVTSIDIANDRIYISNYGQTMYIKISELGEYLKEWPNGEPDEYGVQRYGTGWIDFEVIDYGGKN